MTARLLLFRAAFVAVVPGLGGCAGRAGQQGEAAGARQTLLLCLQDTVRVRILTGMG